MILKFFCLNPSSFPNPPSLGHPVSSFNYVLKNPSSPLIFYYFIERRLKLYYFSKFIIVPNLEAPEALSPESLCFDESTRVL